MCSVKLIWLFLIGWIDDNEIGSCIGIEIAKALKEVDKDNQLVIISAAKGTTLETEDAEDPEAETLVLNSKE